MDYQLFDTQTTAKFLNVSYATLRGLMKRGEITYHRIGKTSIRFTEDDLREFLERTAERAEVNHV